MSSLTDLSPNLEPDLEPDLEPNLEPDRESDREPHLEFDLEPDVILPPSNLWSDEPPLESDLHLQQIILLLECLNWLWQDRNDFYVSGNLTIYYSIHKIKSRDFRGPDFFVVLGADRHPRRSWTVWDEGGKTPNLIVEILSKSTAEVDRTRKKQLYQTTLKVEDYFWFDPETLEFQGFHLVDGLYQPLSPNPQGWLWSQQLQLFLGIHQEKLRFFTADDQLVPTPTEAARAAQQDSELAQQQMRQSAQRAEQEAQRAERLAAKLRELNIDPDTL